MGDIALMGDPFTTDTFWPIAYASQVSHPTKDFQEYDNLID